MIPERIGGCETFYQNLKDMFRDAGAKTVEWTATEHDRIMAVIQCLAQENALAVAGAIQASGYSPGELHSSSSLLYAKLSDIVERVIGGNPRLYAEILTTNKYSKEFAAHLKKQTSLLNRLIKKKDVVGIEKYIQDLKEFSKKFGEQPSNYTKVPNITGHEVGILYREKDEEKIKSLLGVELHIIDESFGYNDDKRDKHKEKKRFELGKIKSAWLKSAELLDSLSNDETIVLADEMFSGNKEYRFQGRTTYLIDNDDFVKRVLSDKEFIAWHVALDRWFDLAPDELMRKMYEEEIVTDGLKYTAIHFNTKRRTEDHRKDWLNVLMAGNTESMPVLNFFETIAFDDWEKRFNSTFVVVRGANRVHQIERQEKEKDLKQLFGA